jgi:hypothetical protein
MSVYIICETIAAITTHVRRVDALTPVRLGGHIHDRGPVLALCGKKVAWDTRLPLGAIGCALCRARIEQLRSESDEVVEYREPKTKP